MNARTCNRLVPLTLLALVAYVPATYAQTATDNMVVRTHVVSNCTVTAPTLDFGQYDKTTGNTVFANVNVNCTVGQPYDVGLSAGANPGGVYGRQMANGLTYLPYDLCKNNACDAGGTPISTGPSDLASGASGTGGAQPYTIYGKVPGIPGSHPAGTYQDTVVVTVSYL